jgi:integrase
MLKSRTSTGMTAALFRDGVASEESQLVDIADALGHKTLNMTRQYAHLEEEGRHDIVALLNHPRRH